MGILFRCGFPEDVLACRGPGTVSEAFGAVAQLNGLLQSFRSAQCLEIGFAIEIIQGIGIDPVAEFDALGSMGGVGPDA